MSDLATEVKGTILRLIAEQGISKSELSRRTGIHQPTLAKLLNGEGEIQTDTIQRIGDALGVKFRIVELVAEHAH